MHDAIGRYHPFDGDGMLHMIRFRDGTAEYRNRFVRTAGFEAEQAAARAAVGGHRWAGRAMPLRDDGWGARGRMKDASSTDVVVHAGTRPHVASTSAATCTRFDPTTLEQLGPRDAGTARSRRLGDLGAHRRSTSTPARCSCSTTATDAPYLHYGVVDATDDARALDRRPAARARACRTTWRSPSTTRSSTTARCSGMPTCSRKGVHVAALPPRPADAASRSSRAAAATDDVRWFEAEPTYVLHWINAYEDGDEIVLDGFFQGDPMPAQRPTPAACTSACSASSTCTGCRPVPHRWRFNLDDRGDDRGGPLATASWSSG